MNVTSAAPASWGAMIPSELGALIVATRTELFLFFVAVAAYLLLFGNANPKRSRIPGKSAKGKLGKVKDDDDDDVRRRQRQAATVSSQNLEASTLEDLEKTTQVAFEGGDHRMVMRCWLAMKKFRDAPAVSLPNIVESMQRTKKDSKAIAAELLDFFTKHQTECHIKIVNDLLDSLARRLDTDLAQQIVNQLPTLGMRPDSRTYELLLTTHFTTRSFGEVRRLVQEMIDNEVVPSVRSTVVVIKTCLKESNFGEAMVHFQRLKSAWGPMSSSEALTSVSSAPRQIVTQLVDFACKDHQLAGFIPLLDGVSLTDDVVGTMLLECIRQKDFELASRVEKLARDQIISFSDSTYSLLVKACSGNLSRVTALVEDFSASGKEPSTELSIAVLSCCVSSGARGKALADRLCSIARPKQPPLLSAFIRYYAETDQPDRACEMYLEHSASARDGQREGSFLDSRAERSLIGAALRCGRHELAQKFLQASPTDVAKHITMIRNCALAGDLEGAKSVFHSLKSGGSELNSVVYNTVLDACVECHKLKDAEAWMAQMMEDGFVDVVSFNTLIKAHLQNENFDKARSLMEEMKGRGLQPNRVTFNELVNGLVTRGSPAQRAGIWPIITEMKEAGVTPNQVTCSILLKSLSSRSSEEDILQTMDLITAMEEPMDEVLLSSVVEACVRIGKPELLSSKLKQLQGGQNITVSGSHTFGSLIKAYGHARDIDGVWRCWKEMRSRHIRPTSITLGCMVEAVVSNGDPEGAYELVHEIQQDEHCREVLNSVIYCSVLKGFTREKKLQRVWAVYEEMLSMNVDLSIVTYNTLIDACARCSQMEKVPEIVQDMKSKNIQPNLITYSTMLKGHCQAGDLQTGFTILEQMRRETRLKPDEIMYNSLIDGCAQNGLVDEGLKLLESMQGEGVQPSNFTLSLLVKLMSRARKLDSAFSLVAELSKKFRFKLNVHVYTNLIQACVSNRQLARGLQTFEEMLLERVQPESRTYAVLIRPSLQQGHLEQAAALARAALGIQQSTLPFLAKAQSIAACHNLDFALLSETLQGLMEHNQTKELAVPLMADIRQFAPRVKIDTAVQRRLLSAGMAQDAGLPAESWAEGHRYGKGGSKGSGKGSKGNYKGHQGYGNRA